MLGLFAQQGEDASSELTKRLTACEEELKLAKARVAYTLAEMENVRAICKRDVDSARKFAVQGESHFSFMYL
jgi:molecular chaperone GrpE (heat shock protein)